MADTPALEIHDLRFKYAAAASEPWVVDLASLSLDPGEQMLLTGGSGSGKSTLLQLIAGLISPVEGRILIKGQYIHTLGVGRRDLFRGESIGMIFQTFNLLHGFTALENVMAALLFSKIPPKEHESVAEDALNELGITMHHALPENMSVGQQQRVAVARAVVTKPVLVLADEPTASLDPENAEIAIGLIKSACERTGAALLCVSHDPAMAGRFERRASLESLTAAPAAAS